MRTPVSLPARFLFAIFVATALVLGLSGGATSLAATKPSTDGPSPEVSQAPPVNRYGHQIVLADLAGMATAIGLTDHTQNERYLLLYPLAAPTVHLFHGRIQAAALSLLLHGAAPVLGFFMGHALDTHTCTETESETCSSYAITGIVLGVLAATILDASLLARDDVLVNAPWTSPQAQRATSQPTESAWMPSVALITRGGIVCKLARTF